MKLFSGQYKNRKVLITGHTGFKGSWLALWLSELGAEITGLSLIPDAYPNHWDLLNLGIDHYIQDIRDAMSVEHMVKKIRPEIVFHLAAQPLVRRSYLDPLETWSTNVIGTANVLEACRKTPSVRAIVIVTSDKCYENKESVDFREDDRLGGHDPYSASKAATEILAASYKCSYFNSIGSSLLATARAGNVIGGGDWSEDRLIPDVIKSITGNTALEIRFPGATRPWQHVLESLSGYLVLGQKLLENNQEFVGCWNFGPEPENSRTVFDVLSQLKNYWPQLSWQEVQSLQPHEAKTLSLDSSKARNHLDWKSIWSFNQTISAVADWYNVYLKEGGIKSREQLFSYIAAANQAGVAWSRV